MPSRVVPLPLAAGNGHSPSRVVPAQPVEQVAPGREFKGAEFDLEDFIRRNIDLLPADGSDGPFPKRGNLLVVGSQPRNDKRTQSYLVAVDGEGNLVLVELLFGTDERSAPANHFETQMVRYAASLAALATPGDLVQKLFAPYVNRHMKEYEGRYPGRTAFEVATSELADFLRQNGTGRSFNQRQRAVVVSNEFDPQTLSGCAWLVKSGIDLRCVAVSVLKYGDQYFMNVEQVLPPRTLEQHFVDFDVTFDGSEVTSVSEPHTLTLSDLMSTGMLKRGDRLYTEAADRKFEAELVDPERVRFMDAEGPKVEDLTAWGKAATGWQGFNVYDRVYVERDGRRRTLDDLRKEAAHASRIATEIPIFDVPIFDMPVHQVEVAVETSMPTTPVSAQQLEPEPAPPPAPAMRKTGSLDPTRARVAPDKNGHDSNGG